MSAGRAPRSRPPMPGIYGFDHLVIRVLDPAAGLAAYSRIFGPGRRPRPATQLNTYCENGGTLEGSKHGFDHLVIWLFDLPNGGYVELVSPTGPPGGGGGDGATAGLVRLGLLCDDLCATAALLRRNGVRVDTERSRMPSRTHAVSHATVHPQSTHGVPIRLVEKVPGPARANAARQIMDTSGAIGVVGFKAAVVLVNDVVGVQHCFSSFFSSPFPRFSLLPPLRRHDGGERALFHGCYLPGSTALVPAPSPTPRGCRLMTQYARTRRLG